MFIVFLYFFKQKTAYEMRISDWSSDVCSSDLMHERRRSPIRPLCLVTGGPDEAPQPAHCDSRMGCIIIAGTGDDCNRHQSRYVAPLSPVVELQQIVRAHDPDEPPFGIAADQFLDRKSTRLNSSH